MAMKIYRGYLRTLLALTEEVGCFHEEQFHTVDGEILLLKPRANTPRNQLIEVYVDDNDCIVHFNQLLAEDVNFTRKDIALMRILPEGVTTTEQHWARVRAAAQRLQSEYRRWSQGLWEVQVTPYVIEGYTGRHHVSFANWTWLKQQVAGNGHNYWHCWGGHLQGVCGHAFMNHTLAWTFSNCSEATMIHEQGHNFGLHHTGTPTAEYGEPTWMGSGNSRSGFHAPHRALLEWIDEESVYWLDPNTSARVFLIDPSSDPGARMPGQFKGAQVRRSFNANFMVSVFNNTVRLHRSTNGRTFSQTTLLATLSATGRDHYPGDGEAPDVKLVDVRDGVFQVVVKWDSDVAEPATAPWPDLVWPENARLLTPEESGLYYQPHVDGQGMDCWFLPDRTEIFWGTYNSRGEPHWLHAQGDTIQNGIRHMKVEEVNSRGERDVLGWMAAYRLEEQKIRIHYFLRTEGHGVMDLDLLALKGPGSRIADIKGAPDSYVSTTQIGDRVVGYINEVFTERTVLGLRRTVRWCLFDENEVYRTSNGMFRVSTPHSIQYDGVIELGEDFVEADSTRLELETRERL